MSELPGTDDPHRDEEEGQGEAEEEAEASAAALEEDVPELTGPEMRQLLYTKYGKVCRRQGEVHISRCSARSWNRSLKLIGRRMGTLTHAPANQQHVLGGLQHASNLNPIFNPMMPMQPVACTDL
jgi:hypothetical protein